MSKMNCLSKLSKGRVKKKRKIPLKGGGGVENLLV